MFVVYVEHQHNIIHHENLQHDDMHQMLANTLQHVCSVRNDDRVRQRGTANFLLCPAFVTMLLLRVVELVMSVDA